MEFALVARGGERRLRQDGPSTPMHAAVPGTWAAARGAKHGQPRVPRGAGKMRGALRKDCPASAAAGSTRPWPRTVIVVVVARAWNVVAMERRCERLEVAVRCGFGGFQRQGQRAGAATRG